MYSWPIRLISNAGGNEKDEELLQLEVPPRGAPFTLGALTHVGHPIHLALVDAYLQGEVPSVRGLSLGDDSRAVVAGLAGPLALLYRLGITHLGLDDLVLLPPSLPSTRDTDQAGRSSFVLTTSPSERAWLACADRHPDEPRIPRPRTLSRPGYEVVTELPRTSNPRAVCAKGIGPMPLTVEVGEPREAALPLNPDVLPVCRMLALGRVGSSPDVLRRAVDGLDVIVTETGRRPDARVPPLLSELLKDAVAEGADHGVEPRTEHQRRALEPNEGTTQDFMPPWGRRVTWRRTAALGHINPAEIARLWDDPALRDQLSMATTDWKGLGVDLAMTPRADGGASLALLPQAYGGASRAVPAMRSLAWAVLEGLLATTLDERPTEAIGLGLIGPGRTSWLSIGWSLVLPRNQRVVAAWLGSDGRVLMRGPRPAIP